MSRSTARSKNVWEAIYAALPDSNRAPQKAPRIPLKLLSDAQITFRRPAAAVAGPAYAQILNPTFVPYTSSGNVPGGAFTLN